MFFKGFLVAFLKKKEVKNLSEELLNKYLQSSGINYSQVVNQNSLFEKVCGYKFCTSKEEATSESNNSIFISGEVFGKLNQNNTEFLSKAETYSLLEKEALNNDSLKLDGNASVLIIDDNRVIVQNDLEGRNKIFHFENEEILIFSSNLPCLLKIYNFNWEISKNAVLSYLLGREVRWPQTFINKVKVLPPLVKVLINSESKFEMEEFSFSNFYKKHRITKKLTKEILRDRYTNVLKRSRTSKVAVTLSGGYDSNCLVKLYDSESIGIFTAVSMGFTAERERDNNIYDETVYAQKIADKLGIRFKKYIINQDEFLKEIDGFVKSLDQPGHDPSSNYFLNKRLSDEGYKSVINGMGGDANFSPNKRFKNGQAIFKFGRFFKINKFIYLLSKRLGFRGPFYLYSNYYLENDKAESFFELYERSKFMSSFLSQWISPSILKNMNESNILRRKRFDHIKNIKKSNQDYFYSLALFCNPDEYHASLMGERNNLKVVMPFIDTQGVTTVMNSSNYNDICNRDFELNIFNGIDEELLVKRKSGFSIPYSEWMPILSNDIFSYFKRSEFFDKKNFNFDAFVIFYNNQENPSDSLKANIIVWKLKVIMEYIKLYNLSY